MIRLIALAFSFAAAIGLAVWAIPARGQDYADQKPLPYTCLPTDDAYAVHVARGDQIIARREQGRFIEFILLTRDGEFLHVSFDRATFRVCALRLTPHDPRQDRSS